ncbi:type 2 lanthipeptide synthetase LanM family protein [Bradyrhizobium brasilense]|uniref:type 2 lanthipeptide synthetase LanM family protein n=1 Tax=Bradyrhizobium brasilense TaxID=1419277 RepID=UPI001E59577D|nr:type 2 lanthipeptide synthetase LanM family protein [Bradyrhizobium brasilense]MCC8971582.1 type 2 lantipeptide synthetase LanM family protein [Bradyrhizobium brasilense]
MDELYERLIYGAATIDELLSNEFEPLPGRKGDTDLAAQRLAAWCRASAGGDWSLFGRRLERDGLSLSDVLARFATVQRNPAAAMPAWITDTFWIVPALESDADTHPKSECTSQDQPGAFEHLFVHLVKQADNQLWASLPKGAFTCLTDAARACLRQSLLAALSNLAAPAIYERFVKWRRVYDAKVDVARQEHLTYHYDRFVAEMKSSGFRELFHEKPVLLRLIASLVRQWLSATHEFLLRLHTDKMRICDGPYKLSPMARVHHIETGLSDPHNGGRSVLTLEFEDGSRIVYKPKDVRLDAAWFDLIERLNAANPPIDLRASLTLACADYGWASFVEQTDCSSDNGIALFFRRAGALLALFHCLASTDMHQENIIAFAEYPIPIDLEMILQVAPQKQTPESEEQAFASAMHMVANSVMMVGFLPAFGRLPDGKIFAVGGFTSDSITKTKLHWDNVNTDDMRPRRVRETALVHPNLPRVAGRYARFSENVEPFVSGFKEYANFLRAWSEARGAETLLSGFYGLPVRKILRPTRFYYMLLQRLKDHQVMHDGALWSAEADFVARLVDNEKLTDPLWPLQRAERRALIDLNIPYFVSTSDGKATSDATGMLAHTPGTLGLDRARQRLRKLTCQDIAWEVEVIRQNTSSTSTQQPRARISSIDSDTQASTTALQREAIFLAEASKIAAEISQRAIINERSAAWISLEWLGGSEVYQLAPMGPDLYNGVSGIALFLAAHAAISSCDLSKQLSLAAIAHLRKSLKGRNAARVARSLGIGGATGMGSVVYALTAIAALLHDEQVLDDANTAIELINDEMISTDKRFDVIDGSAGAILSFLRFHRDTQSQKALQLAIKCADHLLKQSRTGSHGRRSWLRKELATRPLTGFSHGAAGFAYSLASLAAVTGRNDFRDAAFECLGYEESTYDASRNNWPDLRGSGQAAWPCQWCHGATGIGLARLATAKRSGADSGDAMRDVQRAINSVNTNWPNELDTLCCGTLGSIEFLHDSGRILDRVDLCDLASRRLAAVLEAAAKRGDYRWNIGKRTFNLGLFRGLSGVGYACLRQVDGIVPNVLVFD